MSASSGCMLRHAGVDQDAGIGMVDDVHVDRHQLALDVQVGNVKWRDGDRGGDVHGGILEPNAPGRRAARAAGALNLSALMGWNQPDQQATGSTGMRSGPLAGAAKNVAMRTVGASVRLTAEWT